MQRAFAIAVLGALSMGATVSSLPPLTESDWRRLQAGEIVVRSERDADDGAYLVTISGLYQEEPAIIWDVVADCSRFHEFMPRMRESVVVEKDDGASICRTVSDMPLPLPDAKSAVRTWTEAHPNGSLRRRFEQIPGDWAYDRNEGLWVVSPHDGAGGRTLLRYRVAVLPRLAVPSFIVRVAQEQTAPESFEAIRAEARRRRPSAVGAGPPPAD